MTLSTLATATKPKWPSEGGSSPSGNISGKPTEDEVLNAIVTETGCTHSLAVATLTWLQNIVVFVRMAEYAAYYLTVAEMRGDAYHVLDTIMAHGKSAEPGSAHHLVQHHLLDPTKDETALFHDNRDETGSPGYCTVQVAVGVIR